MNVFYKICLLLIIIGGINWGLVGLFDFDLVGFIFGSSQSLFARAIFVIVGLGALGSIPSLIQPVEKSSEM